MGLPHELLECQRGGYRREQYRVALRECGHVSDDTRIPEGAQSALGMWEQGVEPAGRGVRNVAIHQIVEARHGLRTGYSWLGV
jgi:hypothetical protein